jgi:catechol 2,3-dioxygenase-like lactoylglutathione lyase family enzyme
MAEIQMTLGWVIAYVEDPAAAAAFYEDTLGLRTEFAVPGEYAQMDTGTTKLGWVRDPFGTLVELATPL